MTIRQRVCFCRGCRYSRRHHFECKVANRRIRRKNKIKVFFSSA